MPEIEANLSLFKKEGSLIGFSLIAGQQFDAEVFCSDFILKLFTNNAGIYQLDNNGIVFITSSKKHVSFLIESEDITAMRDLLSLNSDMLSIIDCSHLSGGFKLFKRNHHKDYEIIPLSRVIN